MNKFPNKIFSVVVNGVIVKNNKILISQRSFEEDHEPGKWTVPGGKVEQTTNEEWNIIEKTVRREVMEEVGIEVDANLVLITNNTFTRTDGQSVLVMVFLCSWKKGVPQPLEDTINVKWVDRTELDNYEFPPNVKEYVEEGFSLIDGILK